MSIPLALLAAGSVHAQAVPLTGLSNTGSGAYVLTGPSSPAYTIGPHAAWVAAPIGSAWIGPSDGVFSDPVGTYIYTLTLDVSGYFPHTVTLTGNLASDNVASIRVNGVENGFTNTATQYAGLVPFTLAADFIVGSNTIEFVVQNTGGASGNPTGLLVSDFAGTAVPHGSPILSVTALTAGLQATGTIDFATPLGSVAVVWSTAMGASTIPAGNPCSGTVLDVIPPLGGPIVATADALGTAIATGTPPNPGPTIHVQALDLSTCAATNVVTQTVFLDRVASGRSRRHRHGNPLARVRTPTSSWVRGLQTAGTSCSAGGPPGLQPHPSRERVRGAGDHLRHRGADHRSVEAPRWSSTILGPTQDLDPLRAFHSRPFALSWPHANR